MAGIRYSLVYETTWWQDVCRIEPHPMKWEDMVGGIEDVLERRPEIIQRRTKAGSYVLATRDHDFKGVPHMYVLFQVIEWADPSPHFVPPGGKLSLRHVITEEDVRMNLFYDYSGSLAEECQELRRALLESDR